LDDQLDFLNSTYQIKGGSKLAAGAYFLKIELGAIYPTIKLIKRASDNFNRQEKR